MAKVVKLVKDDPVMYRSVVNKIPVMLMKPQKKVLELLRLDQKMRELNWMYCHQMRERLRVAVIESKVTLESDLIYMTTLCIRLSSAGRLLSSNPLVLSESVAYKSTDVDSNARTSIVLNKVLWALQSDGKADQFNDQYKTDAAPRVQAAVLMVERQPESKRHLQQHDFTYKITITAHHRRSC